MNKICTTCKIEKPIDQFKNAKKLKDGKTTKCKACILAQAKEHRRKSPTYFLYTGSAIRIRKEFGYSLSYMKNWVVNQMKLQENKCKLCLTVFKNRSEARLDHDHETGRLRGFLCHRCNLSLNKYITKDWLLKAVDYL